MTREAPVGSSTLGADGERNRRKNQRNRGQMLHKDILLPIAKSSRAIVPTVDGLAPNAISILAEIAACAMTISESRILKSSRLDD